MSILRWTKRRVKCKTLLLGLALVLLLMGFYVYFKVTCSDTTSREFIKDLCRKYNSGEVAGSFCDKLCDGRTLSYQHCTNYPGGKVVVFMICDGCGNENSIRVVLKARKDSNPYGQQHPPAPSSDSEQSMKDFLVLFQSAVRSYFTNEFFDNITHVQDVASFTWGMNVQKFITDSKLEKGEAILLAYKSVMSLVHQPEYLLSRYLHDKSFIPKIYGSCGNAYLVEYTEALHTFEFDFGRGGFSSWNDRARMALKLLDLFASLDQDFKQTLNLCDVKPDNFGKGSDSRVTLIDTDSVFFEEQLKLQFEATNCSSHADCDFFDCRGYCDVTKGVCLPERTNNNMQTLCEDVFQGFSPKLATGLLRDPPKEIRADLNKALQECAYPHNLLERHTARQKASKSTVKKLEAIIRSGLQHSSK